MSKCVMVILFSSGPSQEYSDVKVLWSFYSPAVHLRNTVMSKCVMVILFSSGPSQEYSDVKVCYGHSILQRSISGIQ